MSHQSECAECHQTVPFYNGQPLPHDNARTGRSCEAGVNVVDSLDEFTRAYIECALWSETDNSRDDGGDPLDKNYSIEDIAPEALAIIVADCAKFQREHAALLAQAHYNRREWTDAEMAGHDFWLTRNGHGAGFWDRGLGSLGDTLTEACDPYGECHLTVEDDGKIYVS